MKRNSLVAAGAALWIGAALGASGPPETVEWKHVTFPHALHAGDLAIDCASCHHETNAAALAIPHEQYFDTLWIECSSCHKPGSTAAGPMACSRCHHDSPSGATDETLSAKVVLHRSCWTCHETGRGAAASRACKTCHRGAVTTAAGGAEP